MEDLEPAVQVLHQGAAAFHPVAVIAVEHALDGADLGVVDVPADDALQAAPPRLAGHCGLEVTDIAHRALDLELEVARKTPVREPEAGTGDVEPAIDAQGEFVGPITRVRQPLRALDDAVEQVAVRHPEAPAVHEFMDALVHDVYAAEVVAHVAARELVMVSGHIDDPGALARLAQQFLDDVAVRLRPVPGAAQLPAVDDVADEIERVALDSPKESEQCFSLAAGSAEVQVRDPHGPQATWRTVLRSAAGTP